MFRSLIPFGRSDLARADDPFLALQREMNRLFDESFRGYALPATNGQAFLAPSMDVKETEKAIEVAAELPGVDEKDVQVTFEDGVLTVKGEKKAEKDETKGGYRMSERSYGSFLRSLALPGGVDTDKIVANFDKGILKVTLPKRPEAQSKTKKIEVKAGK